MAKKQESIFSVANNKTAQLNIKITQKLKEDMDDIDKQLAQINPELKFDRTKIAEEALQDATDKAKKELEKLKTIETVINT